MVYTLNVAEKIVVRMFKVIYNIVLPEFLWQINKQTGYFVYTRCSKSRPFVYKLNAPSFVLFVLFVHNVSGMYRNGSLSKILLDKTLFLKTLIKSTIIGFAGEGVNFSHWMELLPPHLHDVPLTELAIPGSHDSCSYSLSPRAPYSDSLNSVVNEVLTYNEHNYNHFLHCFSFISD